jgi:hypothetical protein
LLGGAFNQGSTITITEAGTSVINSVHSLSSGPGGLSWPGAPSRTATLSGPNGLVAGINSVTFTNSLAVPPAERGVKYDFDGDRKADPAVFTPSTGKWTWAASAENGLHKGQPFGQAGDKLVAADYDGDGRTDYAVFRPSNGQWWIQRSTAGAIGVTFGVDSDRPVPADFTGDGRADIALWRPSTGEWLVLRSENFSYYSAMFGTSGDIPVPGDYDGDGKSDTAVFRPSSGTWYVQNSGGSQTLIQRFGNGTDVPIPSVFVP